MPTNAFLAPELVVAREEALTAVIASIAREQTALGRVIEAESEKLKYALEYIQSHPGESEEIDKMLQLAASARAVLDQVKDIQILLNDKYIAAGGDATIDDSLSEPADLEPDPDPSVDPVVDPPAEPEPCPPCGPCPPCEPLPDLCIPCEPELPCIPVEKPRCTCCRCRRARQRQCNFCRTQAYNAVQYHTQSGFFHAQPPCEDIPPPVQGKA